MITLLQSSLKRNENVLVEAEIVQPYSVLLRQMPWYDSLPEWERKAEKS